MALPLSIAAIAWIGNSIWLAFHGTPFKVRFYHMIDLTGSWDTSPVSFCIALLFHIVLIAVLLAIALSCGLIIKDRITSRKH